MDSYRELRVWQTAMDLAEACYRLTREFPRDELFSMTSQVRRAAAAVPANIAEGYGRGSRADYVRFLHIARGSLKELETHLLLAARVGLCQASACAPALSLCEDVGRMLGGLIKSLDSGTS